jgi:nickel superoxide dismutase
MKIKLLFCVAILGLGLSGAALYGHCEIPCGIYTDEMRVQMIEEHCKTIEKAMGQIETLSKQSTSAAANQLSRWVSNKEHHATEIQQIVTQYFMTQRVKPADPDNKKAYAAYVKKLTLLHQILVDAMKCKQTTNAAHVTSLRTNLKAFSALYFVK